MKNRKKIIWIIVGILSFIIILVVIKKSFFSANREGVAVLAEQAKNRTIVETVAASGKISPEVEVKISPDISGEIVELNIKEGDSVIKGQVLAKIYADIYASQRDQAAAGVAQNKAQESSAVAQIEAAQAAFTQEQKKFERQKKLYEGRITSKSEFEIAQQALVSAEVNLKTAVENSKANKAAVKSAEANLNRITKDMNRTTIVAPMTGVVSLLNVKKGEKVAGNSFSLGTEMMRIADLRSIVAQVDVGENDIVKVNYGDTAMVKIDAFGNRKFKGIVIKIANPLTSAVGSNTTSTEVSNYKVHIRLLHESYSDIVRAGKPFPFRPNMSASAEIQTKTAYNVLTIPIASVTVKDKTKSKTTTTNSAESVPIISNNDIDEIVFVIDSSKVKERKITTGIQDINFIQVLSGLKENETIVSGPYSTITKTLKNGDKVRVEDKTYFLSQEDKK